MACFLVALQIAAWLTVLFLLLLTFKLQFNTKIHWAVIFIPIWNIDLFVALMYCCFSVQQKKSLLKVIFFISEYLLFVLFQSFIVAMLAGTSLNNWYLMEIFIPLFAAQALLLIATLPKLALRHYRIEYPRDYHPFLHYPGFIIWKLQWQFTLIAFEVLLAVKLDYNYYSWWWVMLPIFISCVITFTHRCISAYRKSLRIKGKDAKRHLIGEICACIVLGFLMLIISGFFALLAIRLQGNLVFTIAIIFTPFWLLLSVILIIAIIFGIILSCCCCKTTTSEEKSALTIQSTA